MGMDEFLARLGIEKTPGVIKAIEKRKADEEKIRNCEENHQNCKYFFSDGERTQCFKYNIDGVRCH
jgi:hypothetical protein